MSAADSLQWKNPNAGIGAGIDSFYEYLFKAYVMFGNSKYLHMFNYVSAQCNLPFPPFYSPAPSPLPL